MLIQTIKSRESRLLQFIGLAVISLILATFLQLVLVNKASAATITPDGTTCTLDEAVGAMNAGADENGCVATGDAYGTNDTIDIPAGTFSYSNTNTAGVSLTIQGAGMGETVVDLDNSNDGFILTNGAARSARISDLSILDPSGNSIYSENYSMTITRVEISSSDANASGAGIVINKRLIGLSSTIQDVHIHDIDFDNGSAILVQALFDGESSDNVIERVTIDNVNLVAGGFGIVLSAGSNGGTISGIVRNSTITNTDIGGSGGGSYIAAYSDATSGAGTRTSEVTALNNTVVVDRSVTLAVAAGLAAAAVSAPGNTANATINVQNNLVVSMFADTAELAACQEAEIPAGGGTPNATFTSLGGNITDDDTTCNSYFTETNDQTDVSNLASTLGPLQDNGGYTPTIALLTGSPAIDNGITNAVTTDQVGTARPQGSAFDSGAYEYVFASEDDSTTGSDTTDGDETLADTGESALLLGVVAIGLMLSAVFIVRRQYQ